MGRHVFFFYVNVYGPTDLLNSIGRSLRKAKLFLFDQTQRFAPTILNTFSVCILNKISNTKK